MSSTEHYPGDDNGDGKLSAKETEAQLSAPGENPTKWLIDAHSRDSDDSLIEPSFSGNFVAPGKFVLVIRHS